jgi:hypothetical protein
MTIKILVTGDREWTNPVIIGEALLDAMLEFKVHDVKEVLVIHGAARGADLIGEMVAKSFGMPTDSNPAHWRHTIDCPRGCSEMIGRPSGVIRNQKMLDKHPDIALGLAFHPDLTKSRGTKDMVGRLKKANIRVKLYDGMRNDGTSSYKNL